MTVAAQIESQQRVVQRMPQERAQSCNQCEQLHKELQSANKRCRVIQEKLLRAEAQIRFFKRQQDASAADPLPRALQEQQQEPSVVVASEAPTSALPAPAASPAEAPSATPPVLIALQQSLPKKVKLPRSVVKLVREGLPDQVRGKCGRNY